MVQISKYLAGAWVSRTRGRSCPGTPRSRLWFKYPSTWQEPGSHVHKEEAVLVLLVVGYGSNIQVPGWSLGLTYTRKTLSRSRLWFKYPKYLAGAWASRTRGRSCPGTPRSRLWFKYPSTWLEPGPHVHEEEALLILLVVGCGSNIPSTWLEPGPHVHEEEAVLVLLVVGYGSNIQVPGWSLGLTYTRKKLS